MTPTRFMVTLLIGIVGCGGVIGSNTDSGAEASGMSDAESGVWEQCESPSGYALCGGPSNCNPQCDVGLGCAQIAPGVGLCVNPPFPSPFPALTPQLGCPYCLDGAVCAIPRLDLDSGPPIGACFLWEAAELAYRTGQVDTLIYTDSTKFDGTPLPTPEDCPTPAGITLCGGACGDTCPADPGYECLGRSPKHPYSLCVKTIDGVDVGCTGPTTGTNACLTFDVDSADQPIANVNGIYMDRATCEAAAASYPGGAHCI